MERDVSDFLDVGAMSVRAAYADRIIVGVLQDFPNTIALTLGFGEDFAMMECTPARARQIAASLLNKADAIEGL